MAAMLPLVTIAMPAFNEERFIETCIRSVQAQDYPRDRIEILIRCLSSRRREVNRSRA